MATLQNIRSKGPLLVIAVGLALFAFIAGDAWKVLQPHQSQDAGEVNGEAISAQEYQALVEEYTEVVKFSSGMNALSDEQTNQIKDDVWRAYVNNKLIENEAKKIGLTVSKAEVQAIIDAGTEPILQQTPFRNTQTGMFDKDMLKKFLVDYARMDASTMPAQYMEYYESMNKYWLFIERNLIQGRLAEKYQSLLTQALSSNPIEAQAAFDAGIKQTDMLIAAIPYSSIPDSTIRVKESDLKALYNRKKEQFKQNVESRNIKYIDVQVTASPEDKAAIEKEVLEYSMQLEEINSDYTSFIRSAGSDYPFVDLYLTKAAYPADVASRLDEASTGKVYGPYYNVSDNTFNAFKYISKVNAADSIQYRQIQVYAEDITKTRVLADSILNALKKGANFVELAKKYGQEGGTNWLSSAQYENSPLDGDNLKYISAITSSNEKEFTNISLGQANIILQVTGKKVMKDKYKVAVIKRPVEFSKETYNKVYNKFSQFIAANPKLDKMIANAEEAGYKLLERNELYSSEHEIGGVKGTKEALRWAFSAKAGEISELYECGNNDRLMVLGVSNINPRGYRSFNQVKSQLQAEMVKDEKAKKILSEMNATTFSQYQAMPNAVSDSIKHVTFSAPAYVSVLRSSEPLVSAYASVGELNKLSAPIKGNAGVFVLQPYAVENQSKEFDMKSEKANLQIMNARMAGRFMNDLYLKADVKDNRYLYF